jgi:hypothetical protein
MFSSRKRSWADLTPAQRRMVYVAGAAETALTSWALRDLVGRDSSRVRGWKTLWLLAFFVQPVGPIAYLLGGRTKT